MPENSYEPCPFCGCESITASAPLLTPADAPDHERHWNCVCDDCGALGPVDTNKAVAIHLWNQRAPPAPTTPEQIEKQLKTLKAAAAMIGIDLARSTSTLSR